MNPMVFTILAAERRLEAQQQAVNRAWNHPNGKSAFPAAAARPKGQERRISLPWSRTSPPSECSEPC